MKQKKLNNILYVFETTPYVITEDTDAEVINIQLEEVDGFKAINNETVNAKIKPYNYHMLTSSRLEWADYVDDDDPKKDRQLKAKYKFDTLDEIRYTVDGATILDNDSSIGPDGHLFICLYDEDAECEVPYTIELSNTEIFYLKEGYEYHPSHAGITGYDNYSCVENHAEYGEHNLTTITLTTPETSEYNPASIEITYDFTRG